eukprot:snap_masked-scaffold5_size1054832-processed-gene-0.1 protein:Tk04014 transcript:snap_masked-scaffold5_size1054832-processed-gene-0.1-mRNA-1 annotation:"transient receptor potential cation channel protein painless"
MDIPMSQKKKPTVGDFVRTGSCVGEPQANALHCLLNRELTVFTDVLNDTDTENRSQSFPLPDDHWINQAFPEEDDKTLLMLALEKDLHDFTKVLLQTGASGRLYNHILGRAPVHVAALSGNLRSLQLLFSLKGNQPDINATMRSNGRTALHLCVEKKHGECVNFLLDQPGIDVNIKDKKNGQTALYMAVKASHLVITKALVEAGADYDYVCFGKTIFPELMADKLPGFHPNQVRRKNPPIVQQLSQGTFEALADILEKAANRKGEGPKLLEDFRSLLLQTDSFTLNNRVTNGSTLLQKACDLGLVSYVAEILNEEYEVNPDGVTEARAIPPILLAANRGHIGCIKELVQSKVSLDLTNVRTDETILHCLLKGGRRNDEHFVQDLLDILGNEAIRSQIQKIINQRDLLENTALHYATQMWPQTVVRSLLDLGANIGMTNHWNETPVTKILPQTLEAYLDDCIEAEGDVNHEKFEVTYNYSFLAPPKEDLPFVSRQDLRPSPSDPESQKLAEGETDERVALPETQTLWHMGQSKAHRHLLKHPVVTSFLYLKWSRIRRYFNRNLRFYLLFVFILTWYIFERFGGKSLRDSEAQDIPALFILYAAFALVLVAFILRDWAMDIKDLVRSEKVKSEDEEATSSVKFALIVMFSNWVECLFVLFLGAVLWGGEPILWHALLFLTILLLIREFFQVSVSLKRYIVSPENWIEVSMIILIGFILFWNDTALDGLNRHFSAIVLVLSWAELITLVGKHPKLTTYNVYVTMFYKVLGTFFFFLCWYVFFIIAFGLGFYIMLHKDGPNDDVAGPDDYVFFNRPWTALVKTSTMFVGELEFSDIPINLDSRLGALSYAFFLSFVFLIVVVLMNLLNGLAVSDTGLIQEKAEIVSYISRVETISYTESILLGDPFNFLSQWPALKWLLNIPSCSLCAQLSKSRTMQRIFNKITGATGILLFYTFLPTKKLTLQPNVRKSRCDCLRVELMDDDIIARTKEIVLQKATPNPEEDRWQKLEGKLGLEIVGLNASVGARMANLEAKMDLLLSSLSKR